MKRRAVVFSGAGLSAESGIPTFRDSDGLWENHRVEDVATPEGWARDRKLVLQFYRQRYEAVKKADPNAAHKAIANMEDKFDVTNITQNIDDLLERAGCTNVVHLHGSVNWRKCEWHKDASFDTRHFCDWKERHEAPAGEEDRCPKCGGWARPDVVWFGEPVGFDNLHLLELSEEVQRDGGVFIVVGTSAQVYPAAKLIPIFSQVARKYIVDPKPLPVAGFTLLAGPAGDTLPGLVASLCEQT